MIPVGRLAPGDQWDQNCLDLLFANKLYPTGLEFKRIDGYPNTDGCVLIVPARYWYQRIDEINEAAARYQWLLLIKTSDEEALFDTDQIEHPNARFWIQSPRTDRDYGDARLFGVGFPPHFNQLVVEPPTKSVNVFLAAQNTHERRNQAFAALGCRGPKDGCVREDQHLIWQTEGFTQGLPRDAYVKHMMNARAAPAPTGPASPDTFRLYEALEAHCVPIADDITPGYDSRGYWRMLFPDAPFPILTDYASLPGYINDALRCWPINTNRITAWWLRQKRAMAHWLREDLEQLGAAL